MAPIEEVTIFVQDDEGGHEAVLCQSLPGREGMMMQMIASTPRQYEEMLPAARKIQKISGRPVRVIRLHGRTVLRDKL